MEAELIGSAYEHRCAWKRMSDGIYGLLALLLGAQEPQESGREALSSPDLTLPESFPVWTLA